MSTYTPTEADKAAAEKYCPKTSENELATTYDVREAFLAGIQHAKASASPAREEYGWNQKLHHNGESWVLQSEAESNFNAFIEGQEEYNYEIRKQNKNLKAELEKARAENAAMKEALEFIASYSIPTSLDVSDDELLRRSNMVRGTIQARAREALAKLQGAGEKV